MRALNRCFLACLLAIHAALLIFSGACQSPTLNEPAHLVAGLHHWEHLDFSLYRVNPPLIRTVAAIPAVWLGYDADWTGYRDHVGARPVFGISDDFVSANGRNSVRLIQAARWTLVPLSLLGALVSYAWARDLFGPSAGLLATTLWCFSPMLLAYASMIAPDAHAASLGLASCYAFWRWLRDPTWRRAVAAGFLLGLAELSKTTLVVFVPLWPLVWGFYRWRDRRFMKVRQWRDGACMLLAQMVIGIYVINVGYLGQGTLRPLKEYRFVSKFVAGSEEPSVLGRNRFDGHWLGEIRVPLPANYILGMDLQQRDFEDFGRPSYLRGEYQATGWWYYYAYAMLIKTPLGTLGLLFLSVLASCTCLKSQAKARDLLVLLAPAGIIFLLASFKSGFSHHVRYVLPCIPFGFIWIGGLARHVETSCYSLIALGRRPALAASISRQRFRSCVLGTLVVCLLTWTTVSSLRLYPHSLSYFNEMVGGPMNGPKHLLNSNVDWGQDLLFLERWMQDAASLIDTPVYLAFYNHYNPFDIGVERIAPWPFRDSEDPPSKVPPGLHAVSVNLLYDFPWPVQDRDGRHYMIDRRPMARLRNMQPVGSAGYSIRIFSAEQLSAAYQLPEQAQLWIESVE
ncbi:MAG: glycosyltransferase family 39 protein [Planctomycetota bacterium]